MTTTLRPLEAEQRPTDADRARRYAVCVNGRSVGEVRLATEAGTIGVISELRIDPGDRRRGRGTAAVLAGEEVLRSWGCVRATASIPGAPDTDADAGSAGLRLAGVLGYTVHARQMAKHLDAGARAAGPGLPPGCALRPFGAAEFADWETEAVAEFANSLTRTGVPAEAARRRAEEIHRATLPQGAASPGTVLRRLVAADGTHLGMIWVALDARDHPDGRRMAWIYRVETEPGQRGRGYGRALMLAAEDEVLAAGGADLGLNVFATNVPANSLYRSLGYRTYATSVGKPL